MRSQIALYAGLLMLGAVQARAAGRVVQPMDVIAIRVVEAPDLSMSARVAPDGTIRFPYVGRIKAAGRTEDEVADVIERRLIGLKILANP